MHTTIDLGLKKKKKKAVKKDAVDDDDFAAKLAALDIEREAAEEPADQEGDMCVPLSFALLNNILMLVTGMLELASFPTTRLPPLNTTFSWYAKSFSLLATPLTTI